MTNSTNADVCRFLEQLFDTGNQFEQGKSRRAEGNHAKIRPWCGHYLDCAKGLVLKR